MPARAAATDSFPVLRISDRRSSVISSPRVSPLRWNRQTGAISTLIILTTL